MMKTTQPDSKPRKSLVARWLPNLLLVGFTSIVGVAFCEVAVRMVAPQAVMLWQPGPFAQDEPGFFRMRPGHQGVLTNRVEYKNSIRINSAGLRGVDSAPASDNVCRGLAIGDSFTFGVGVEETELFHQLARQQLTGEEHAVEMLNGGIPAIGVPQEIRWLERHGLALEPDLVLLNMFVGNDLRDAEVDVDRWNVIDGQLAPPGAKPGLKDWLYNHVHLFVLLKNAVPSGLQQWVRGALGMGEPWSLRYAREVFEIYHRETTPLVRRGLQRTEAAVDRWLELAERDGFQVAVTLIPDIVQVDPERWQAALRQLELPPDVVDPRQPNRLLRDAFERRGIPVLDLTDAFVNAHPQAQADGAPLYFPIDRHWTVDGHRLAGDATARFLAPMLDACPQPLPTEERVDE